MPRKSKKDEPLREAKVVETPEDNNQDVYIPDDSMMMMNEGQAFHDEETEEKVKEEISEDQAMFAGNEALVQAVFEWMDNEVADTDSIKTVRSIAEKYKLSTDQAIAVCDVIADVIQLKRVQFQNIYDTINTKETNS